MAKQNPPIPAAKSPWAIAEVAGDPERGDECQIEQQLEWRRGPWWK
ncbi:MULTISPECIES: hypothetical protein [unclassified Microbacterium]|nr:MULTISPECIES: hypothetical protein [unclassified Microbacterium]